MATTSPVAVTSPRGKGPVTRAMAQARTRELAVLAGRDSLAVTQADYEQARRELTGETDMNRQEAVFDAPAPTEHLRSLAADTLGVWENEGGQTLPSLPLGLIR